MSETPFLGLHTVAAVLDPFGNAFGIIENPNFRLGG